MSRSTTIALIGAPGAGKSTVGPVLASRLAMPFVDVDATIAASEGKPIAEIFADSGEAHFRALERTATLAALEQPAVVAVGGGAVLIGEVAEALRTVTAVWLEVSVTQASRRLGLNQAGGLVLGNLRASLIKLLAERTPVYQNLATITIATDRVGVEAIVEEIVTELKGAHR